MRTLIRLDLTEPQIERLIEILYHEAQTDETAVDLYDALGGEVGNARCSDCGRMMFGSRLESHPCAEWQRTIKTYPGFDRDGRPIRMTIPED